MVLKFGDGTFVVADVAVGALTFVEWVGGLECTEQVGLLGNLFLLRERQRGAVGSEVRVESCLLTHVVYPRLVAVQDFVVLLCKFFALLVLFTLIRVNRITHLVQMCEWLRYLGGHEAF